MYNWACRAAVMLNVILFVFDADIAIETTTKGEKEVEM